MQNRAILVTLRAAALVIIATGLNDVIASAIPRYEPLYLYLAAIAAAALLDGILIGLLAAILSIAFYALLFMPSAELLTPRIVIPIAAAIGTALAGAVIRGAIRTTTRRRPAVDPIFPPAAPPLIDTSPVAHVTDNATVLAAIDSLRGEMYRAIADLNAARDRADELEILRRGQNAEREAVEARMRSVEHERDWALKVAEEAKARADRERASRLDAERQLAEAREESASMAGRVAELELAAHEADRVRAETTQLRRAVELERTRADGEKALREAGAAEAAKLRTRIAELEEALAAMTPTTEVEELRRVLAEARAARERSRAEAVAEKQRADGLERAVTTARAEVESRVADERRRAEAALARVTELEATITRLEAEAAQFDQKVQTLAAHLASDHEADLGQAVSEREAARAEARGLRARAGELEATLSQAVTDCATARAEARRLEARAAELESQLTAERATRERLEGEAAAFDAKLQTIVTHLASDHEADLGQALSEKEEARAEARAMSMKLATVQRKLDDAETLLTETRTAAQAEIDRLHVQLAGHARGAGNRPRVLIVHPDADVRTTAGASLERAGYEVVSAADGLEALRVAIAQQPEVVIAESSMPKMDGRELCQLLKSQEKTAHIRFVLLMRATDEAPRGELTPDEVLRKPVPVETLKSTLANLLQASKP